MADPWSDDFAALGQHSRARRFYKSHPALAALLAAVMLTAVGGAAYAVVREVEITIDPQASPAEIESDVHAQLEAAGVPSSVQAEKSEDGRLELRIGTNDPQVGSDVKIHINGVPAEQDEFRLQLEVQCDLTPAQQTELTQLASSEQVVDLVVHRDGQDDQQLGTAIAAILANAGWKAVDVHVDHGQLTLTVKSAPAS